MFIFIALLFVLGNALMLILLSAKSKLSHRQMLVIFVGNAICRIGYCAFMFLEIVGSLTQFVLVITIAMTVISMTGPAIGLIIALSEKHKSDNNTDNIQTLQ